MKMLMTREMSGDLDEVQAPLRMTFPRSLFTDFFQTTVVHLQLALHNRSTRIQHWDQLWSRVLRSSLWVLHLVGLVGGRSSDDLAPLDDWALEVRRFERSEPEMQVALE